MKNVKKPFSKKHKKEMKNSGEFIVCKIARWKESFEKNDLNFSWNVATFDVLCFKLGGFGEYCIF